MSSLELFSRQDSTRRSVLFRFVRTDSNLIVAEYPMEIRLEDITTHRDLIGDDMLAEIALGRRTERGRFDAGTLDVQPFYGDGYILVYSHSQDLMLPVSREARFATSRLIQQKVGRPRRVRAQWEFIYG